MIDTLYYEHFSSEFMTKKFSQPPACMDSVISKQKGTPVSGTDNLVKKNDFLHSEPILLRSRKPPWVLPGGGVQTHNVAEVGEARVCQQQRLRECIVKSGDKSTMFSV